ncbi:hypothetical protein M409DRAFT_18009 [Zasmidium cellare ATCC 36951]|uniref:Uncharacterized protein n=1 Tax=Zasmidium cellare ATCC 36951 TaxID=1080233 RepID=A0A6A6CXL7_ZASCE|nr:uncharacterized protein M409DRAFT_18009 [Zasmidium cellare ATCC 36951]KAF2171775.1 hypothetical protein M409DRAFT_18009 [Zasmidium cellare ATCC 36951]
MKFTLLTLALGLTTSLVAASPVEKLPNGVDSYSTRSSWSKPGAAPETDGTAVEERSDTESDIIEPSPDCYSTRSAWKRMFLGKRQC